MARAVPAREDFRGRRVVIMGLGLFGGGAGAARYFARKRASVLVTDLRDAAILAPSVAALRDHPVELRLGEHREEDFLAADLVVANPAVRPDSEMLELVRGAGIPVESEISLFLERSPAPVYGVTGSNGKTTTTRLMGEVFRAGGRRVFVGGNVGGSILERVDDVRPQDAVVLELSSFQGEDLERIRFSPHGSVVLNLTPNHLDRHGTFEAYEHAKRSLVRYQKRGDFSVLSFDDPRVRSIDEGEGRKIHFSRRHELREGVFVRSGQVVARFEGREEVILPVDRIPLLGEFNRANVLAAIVAPLVEGVDPAAVASAVASFRPVEHRLEPVATLGDTVFYDDSISTTPESTLAALEAVPRPRWLIAGGADKGSPLDHLARGVCDHADGIALIGATAQRLGEAIERVRPPGRRAPVLCVCGRLEGAIEWLFSRSDVSGSVLLSPGFASYDQFANFVQRGNEFRLLVRARVAEAVREGAAGRSPRAEDAGVSRSEKQARATSAETAPRLAD